jgi:hypothetical protein
MNRMEMDNNWESMLFSPKEMTDFVEFSWSANWKKMDMATLKF